MNLNTLRVMRPVIGRFTSALQTKMAPSLVEHVVADAGAFLKRTPLQCLFLYFHGEPRGLELGKCTGEVLEVRGGAERAEFPQLGHSVTEEMVCHTGRFPCTGDMLLEANGTPDIGKNIYTLKDVVDEIRDKATRRSLAILPYQLNFKEPHPEHIRHVTEFSKKTGDYPSLSATDIKVLALTFQLELEHVGSEHLKKEPDTKVNIHSTQRHPEAPVNVAGFHLPSMNSRDDSDERKTQREVQSGNLSSSNNNNQEFNSFQFWREPVQSLNDDLLGLLDISIPDKHKLTDTQTTFADTDQNFNSFQFWREPVQTLDEELLGLLSGGGATDKSDDENKENEPEDDEDEDDDGGGWITPSNIQQVKMESTDWTAPVDVTVGCLTTDFAMQNVLIQMGLHVLSVNGMLIKQARSYILRCHACFRTTSNMNKVFCPHCGNQTLKKLAVTVNEDGNTMMHFSKNPKVLNPRGLRHSLPLPRGGKHGENPRLTEDQRFPQQRLSRKARQKTDVFDPDYLAGSSPFMVNDIYSRAANLNIRDGQSGGGRRRANPNAARKKFVKK